ncbi:MAG: hypothetical protein HJJLKODD_02549 [Phycisphaerae bacterium]|nr:hypothetical protein [Phycisphaerae bacterium]
MARRIKKDDIVQVISGEHAGQRGKVLRVLLKSDKVVVEGVNMVYRHVRPSRRNPQGGRLQKEAPLHVSNVQPIDPKTDRPSRVRFEVELSPTGRVTAKRRVTLRGAVLHELRRPEK